MKDRKARVENGGIKEGREKVRGVSKKATIQEHPVFPRRCSTIAPDFSLDCTAFAKKYECFAVYVSNVPKSCWLSTLKISQV